MKRLKWIILLSFFFTSACVYDKEFAYMNDQIVNLNKRISGLENSVDEELNDKEKGFESDLQSINSYQSELRLEIDQLRGSVQELSGRIEENEHLLKRSVEKDLNEQDAIKAELNDLSQLEKKIQELENALLVQQAYLNLGEDSQNDGKLITDKKDVKPREIPKNSELDLYNRAYDMYKQGNIDGAMDSFNKFLTEFPNSDRADNAQFWIGECLMAMKQHKKAILAYEDVIKNKNSYL